MLRVGEKVEHGDLLVAFMPLERFQNGLGREALMDKKRQGWHIERQTLGLARPIQEWRTESLELIHGILKPGDRGQHRATAVLKLAGLVETVRRLQT